MAEFSCSVCEYTSCKKENVTKHINKKKSCGPGIKEIIEIPVDIRCEWCNKKFSTKSNLKEHEKESCKNKNRIIQKQLKEAEDRNKELEKLHVSTRNTIIRSEARKLYNEKYKKLHCTHCNNKNRDNIQICHIKAVKDFNILTPIDVINHLSNIISLCANCHLDLDKSNKFEVTRTAILHSFIIRHLEIIEKGPKRYQEYLEQKYNKDIAKLIREEVELVLYNRRHLIN
jgi:hypothetical protein